MTGQRRVCTVPGCSAKPTARRLCRRHYQAAWKAGELDAHVKLPRRAKLYGHVCPPEHKHDDSSTCYVLHQCRCDACSTAQGARNRQRKKAQAYGRYDTGLVDVSPVREHVLMLGEYGIGYKRVSMLAGFNSSTPVRTIIWGRQDPGPRFGEMQKRVKRETAEKILAIKPEISNLAPHRSIPALGTLRRIQALASAGWSLSKIAARLGMTGANLATLLQRDHVQVSTWRAVRELFDELWDQEPPRESWHDRSAYTRTVRFAKARRWLPALAWDDPDTDVEPPTIEDGDELIDDMAVELALMGERPRLTPAERREAVRRLHAERWSDGRVAEQLGITDKTVLRIRVELGLTAFDQNALLARSAS